MNNNRHTCRALWSTLALSAVALLWSCGAQSDLQGAADVTYYRLSDGTFSTCAPEEGEEEPSSSGGCIPGAVSWDGCNECVCTESGSWACTERACEGETEPCDEGTSKKVACNTCWCIEGGWSCTELICPSEPACEEGATKEVECNTCWCIDGGWSCTELICPSEPACEEGATKEVECNTCVCVEGGWACTERACGSSGSGSVPGSSPSEECKTFDLPECYSGCEAVTFPEGKESGAEPTCVVDGEATSVECEAE